MNDAQTHQRPIGGRPLVIIELHVEEAQPLHHVVVVAERLRREIRHDMQLCLARADEKHAAERNEVAAERRFQPLLDGLGEVERTFPRPRLDVQTRARRSVTAEQVAHEPEVRAVRQGTTRHGVGRGDFGIVRAVARRHRVCRRIYTGVSRRGPVGKVGHQFGVLAQHEEGTGAGTDQQAGRRRHVCLAGYGSQFVPTTEVGPDQVRRIANLDDTRRTRQPRAGQVVWREGEIRRRFHRA